MVPFPFTFTQDRPLYEQLYAYLAGLCTTGALQEGERLPSKRALCAHLHVSQSTVEHAYELLVAEGYVEAKAKSGYYAHIPKGLRLPAPVPLPPLRKKPAPPPVQIDFSPSKVDTTLFPYTVWARLMSRACQTTALLAPGDPAGDFPLREQIARYVYAARGVRCHPDQVIVGAGVSYLLTVLSRLLPKSASYAYENPGYLPALRLLKDAGKTCIPIPVDDKGMDVSRLRQTSADVAYVTPSSQFPTGAVMPIGRRAALLDWAGTDKYIIEDDYNSEFRFHGRPIPSLQGLDSQNRVIYLSTFSKTIAPSIRIAFMVLPPSLVYAYDRLPSAPTVSRFEQHALTAFLKEGHYARQVSRMRKLYEERQSALISCLSHPKITIVGKNAGLHLLVRVNRPWSETRLIAACLEQGIRIYPLSAYHWAGQPSKPAVLFGYAGNPKREIFACQSDLFSAWQLDHS